MNNTISSIRSRDLSQEAANKQIRFFVRRFGQSGQSYLYLAYHAAFPLALTPDLLYALWANFPYDVSGKRLHIPWVAVADLLLSNLCTEVSPELYEIDTAVRFTLLKALQADPHFGEQRIRELSNFLLGYIDQQLRNSDSDTYHLAQAQQWMALAYTEPKAAAQQLAKALASSLKEQNIAEQLRVASLIETFAEQLADFPPLLTYARGIKHLVYNDREGAMRYFETLAGTQTVGRIDDLTGVHLPDPVRLVERDAPVKTVLSDIVVAASQTPSSTPGSIDTPMLTEDSQLPFIDPQDIAHPDPIINPNAPSTPPTTCICPSCFTPIYLGDCRIVSRRFPGKVLKEAPPAGLPDQKLQRIRSHPEPLNSPQYSQEEPRRECPVCKYLLPPNESVPTITLAVIGNTFAGKSHYIASLLHQIKKDWLIHAEGYAQLTCLTPEVEAIYEREYIERLFVKQQKLDPTQPKILPKKQSGNTTPAGATPLIYELSVSSSPDTQPRAINFFIYDSSGEDYESEERLVQLARFVFHSGAFIFVVDPSSILAIRQQLPPRLIETNLPLEAGSARNMNQILPLYESYHKYEPGSTLPDIPIAVMISKSDLFRYLNLPTSYTFMTNPRYRGSIDLQEIDQIDQEVKELFERYKQGDILAATRRFKRVKFFATSATGEPPDAKGYFTKVEPCRCLDPMLWILYEFGLIKASK